VHLLYEEFLHDPCHNKIPPIAMVHGPAGTGKSHVVRGIDAAAIWHDKLALKTSFNSITALNIGGPTFSSLVNLDSKHMQHSGQFTPEQLAKFRLQYDTKKLALIIIDEISTFTPWHLARLDAVCKQVTGNDTDDFGGIPILLVGDMNQLGPVKAGKSLTQALLAIAEYKATREQEQQQGKKWDRLRKVTLPHKKRRTAASLGLDNQTSAYTEGSPMRKGSELFSKAVLFNLLEHLIATRNTWQSSKRCIKAGASPWVT
jgi:hypothetical protein